MKRYYARLIKINSIKFSPEFKTSIIQLNNENDGQPNKNIKTDVFNPHTLENNTQQNLNIINPLFNPGSINKNVPQIFSFEKSKLPKKQSQAIRVSNFEADDIRITNDNIKIASGEKFDVIDTRNQRKVSDLQFKAMTKNNKIQDNSLFKNPVFYDSENYLSTS